MASSAEIETCTPCCSKGSLKGEQLGGGVTKAWRAFQGEGDFSEVCFSLIFMLHGGQNWTRDHLKSTGQKKEGRKDRGGKEEKEGKTTASYTSYTSVFVLRFQKLPFKDNNKNCFLTFSWLGEVDRTCRLKEQLVFIYFVFQNPQKNSPFDILLKPGVREGKSVSPGQAW